MWGRTSKQRRAAVRRHENQQRILDAVAKVLADAAGARNSVRPPTVKKRVAKKRAPVMRENFAGMFGVPKATVKRVSRPRSRKITKAPIQEA